MSAHSVVLQRPTSTRLTVTGSSGTRGHWLLRPSASRASQTTALPKWRRMSSRVIGGWLIGPPCRSRVDDPLRLHAVEHGDESGLAAVLLAQLGLVARPLRRLAGLHQQRAQLAQVGQGGLVGRRARPGDVGLDDLAI